MKKTLFILSIFILIFSATSVYAASTVKLFYDNQWHSYKAEPMTLFLNNQAIELPVQPVILEGSTLVPIRAISENLGAKVTWNESKRQVEIVSGNINILLTINDKNAIVNGNTYKMPNPAKIINGSTMVPVRFVAETMGVEVNWDETYRVVDLFKSKIGILDIKANTDAVIQRVTITADEAIDNYTAITMDNGPRLVLDIQNAKLKYNGGNVAVDGLYAYQVRYSQYTLSPDVTRIVVDLSSHTNYKTTLSEDKKQLFIDFDQSPAVVRNVNFATLGGADIITIETDKPRNPVVTASDEGGNIVVDIPMATLSGIQNSITSQGSFVQGITYSQVGDNTVRLNIQYTGVCLLKSLTNEVGTKITFSSFADQNLRYVSSPTPTLTVIDDGINANYFNYALHSEDKKCTVSVQPGVIYYNPSKLLIYDGIVNFISIGGNPATGKMEFIVNSKQEAKFNVNTVENANTLSIGIEPLIASAEQVDRGIDRIDDRIKNMLVYIDPGHGGSDTGAVYGAPGFSLKEKDINLKISLMAANLLREAGIQVMLSRQEDTAVDLYERANMANRANASLFVSVHNNSGDVGENGTMALFYPVVYDAKYGISGERFAQIMQEEMLEKLGRKDRGLWKRPGLVVLNNTLMPSVLTEFAYLSDYSDRQLLIQDEFLQKAAQAVFVATVRALNESIGL